MDLSLCGCLQGTLYYGISIKPAEFKSSQANRFGCNNNHNYLIDNKIGRFIIHHIILVNGNWLLVITIYHLPFTNCQSPVTSYQSARLGPIKVVENRRQKAEVKRPKTEVLSSVFCLLSSVFCLLSSVFATASRQGTGWIQAECRTFCTTLLPAPLSFLSENRLGGRLRHRL